MAFCGTYLVNKFQNAVQTTGALSQYKYTGSIYVLRQNAGLLVEQQNVLSRVFLTLREHAHPLG